MCETIKDREESYDGFRKRKKFLLFFEIFLPAPVSTGPFNLFWRLIFNNFLKLRALQLYC